MDMQALAAAVTGYLAPVMPYLVKLGEKGSEVMGEKLAAGAWDKAKEMWQKLHPRVDQSAIAIAAVREVAKAPDDPDAQAALRLQLKNILAADAGLASEVARLIEAAKQDMSYRAELHGSGAIAQGPGAVAAGESGIAVGGNVHGGVHGSGRPRTRK